MCFVLKDFESCRIVKCIKSIGRLQKLSRGNVMVTTLELVKDHKQVFVDIIHRSGFNVSTSTVRNALHDVNIYHRAIQ
jgi:hypothetical protein